MTASDGAADRSRPLEVNDPRALTAMAHPVRLKIIARLFTLPSARAADLARALDLPANAVSFHLRQLAKYGIVEEEVKPGADRRERWWRLVSDQGFVMDPTQLVAEHGGRAAIRTFERISRGRAMAMVQAMEILTEEQSEHHVGRNDVVLRLTPDQLEQYHQELFEVMARWAQLSRNEPDDDEHEAYASLAMTAPLDLLDSPPQPEPERSPRSPTHE